MQSFDCNGLWWLPENPSERVAGVLRFSEDSGALLSLSGTLGEATASFQEKTIPIVLGQVYDCPLGNEITLRKCQIKGIHLSSHNFTREDYRADRLFIGSYLNNDQDFSFAEVNVALSGLACWADAVTGLSGRPVPPVEGRRPGFEIQWSPPAPLSGQISGGTLVLGFAGKLSQVRRKQTITESVQIRITLNEPASEVVLNKRYVYPLQNFMTLATDHPNALTELNVRRPEGRDDIRILGERVFTDDQAAADLLPHKMLFTLEDVRHQAVQLIGKWFEISERLQGVCNPYFGILYKPDSFGDTKFLTVYQSLEVYERSQRISRGEPETADTSARGERLARLLEQHTATVGPLFGDDLQSAVTEVVRFRNYVVHRDSEIGASPQYGEHLFWWTQRLMFLMKACFLTELGILVEDQLRFFQRNQMYLHILGLTEKAGKP